MMLMTEDFSSLVDVAEAARRLGVSRRRVLFLLAQGRLHGRKFRGWALTTDSVQRFERRTKKRDRLPDWY